MEGKKTATKEQSDCCFIHRQEARHYVQPPERKRHFVQFLEGTKQLCSSTGRQSPFSMSGQNSQFCQPLEGTKVMDREGSGKKWNISWGMQVIGSGRKWNNSKGNEDGRVKGIFGSGCGHRWGWITER